MKNWPVKLFTILLPLLSIAGASIAQKDTNTLLWQISGNGLRQPSYLFGTIHMLCKDDAVLSDSLKKVIKNCKDVYLEVDMDNLFEMMGLMKSMKMRNDTTLADLMDKKDYDRVKTYFQEKSGLIPFSMLETYKPL